MYISSAGSRSRLLIAIRGVDIKFSQLTKNSATLGISTDPNKTPQKLDQSIILLDGTRKLERK